MAGGVLLVVALWPAAAFGAGRIFWANFGAPGSIASADLQGTGGGDLDTTGATVEFVGGAALDPVAGRVWWVSAVTASSAVWSAKADGSGGVTGPLDVGTASVANPNGAVIVPTLVPGGRIYWADNGDNTIAFANLDGSGGGQVPIDAAFVHAPDAVAVDPVGGHIYWTNQGDNSIAFADLDGSHPGRVHTGAATTDGVQGVAVDAAAGRIYWANTDGNTISFADLSNTGAASDVAGDLDTTGATVHFPRGIALDPIARRIYWGNAGSISFADLDGHGGGGDVETSGDALNVSNSLALLAAPVEAAAPVIDGGARTGTPLSCSRGSWAPDLVASAYYRSPQSFSFQWSRNGADVPGATQDTLTPDAVGDYRCRVTAHGAAGVGDATATSDAHAVTLPPLPPPTGTGTGTGTGGPSAFGASTRVTLALAAGRIPARGPVAVRIANANAFAVSGTLSGQTTRPVKAAHRRRVKLSTRRLTVKARSTVTVKLSLPSPLRRLLAGQRRLSLAFALAVGDPAGHHRTVKATLTPRLLVAKRAR